MKFDIYKRGQGKYTRLCSAFGWAIIAGLGCLALYQKLQAADFWGVDPRTRMWLQTMMPVGLFVILCLIIYWLVNKPSLADFMISAEGEMKKVSWSSKKEIAVSTSIVIVVVILMAVFLGITDTVFQLFFNEVIGI